MAKTQSKGKGGSTITKVMVNKEVPEDFIETLKARFEKNMARHASLDWKEIQSKLEVNHEKRASLSAMEHTGGEPDVIGYDETSGEYLFCDCAKQSPEGRRSICYDGPAEQERVNKGVHPGGNAVDLAEAMGIELLTEAQYRELQRLGEFDTTTSSWIMTPEEIRNRGGALFADRRYDHVFVYHNGAPSFYAARGFRGVLRV